MSDLEIWLEWCCLEPGCTSNYETPSRGRAINRLIQDKGAIHEMFRLCPTVDKLKARDRAARLGDSR